MDISRAERVLRGSWRGACFSRSTAPCASAERSATATAGARHPALAGEATAGTGCALARWELHPCRQRLGWGPVAHPPGQTCARRFAQRCRARMFQADERPVI